MKRAQAAKHERGHCACGYHNLRIASAAFKMDCALLGPRVITGMFLWNGEEGSRVRFWSPFLLGLDLRRLGFSNHALYLGF